MRRFAPRKWDLAELVTDPDSPSFRNKLKEIESLVGSFEKNKARLLPGISEKQFLGMLRSLEEIIEKFSRVSGY
ncbi:MAG: oligoendopeptidase F, partial [Thaumarchaeota archaeon]|nr:oligoendopeptidase F [Nitrososphaerota archaeon]